MFSHPGRRERDQRELEQQVPIGPENRPSDLFGDREHMVMVVPVDTDVDKTQNVTQQHWNQRPQCVQAAPLRHLEFQNHDGDDDRDHPVAKGRQPLFSDGDSLSFKRNTLQSGDTQHIGEFLFQ
jgi:hypothetical protein